MTEQEEKIWNLVHEWCNGQYHEIPDQNRRDLMDRIKTYIGNDRAHCVNSNLNLLAVISFSSSITTYKVEVTFKGSKTKWYATRLKNGFIDGVVNVWSSSKYEDEYRKLKKSERKKIRAMITHSVKELLI